MAINKKYIYGIGAILIISIFIASQYFARERGKKYFKEFDKAKIDAVLMIDAYIFDKGSGIKLTDGSEYVFYPHTNKKLNQNKIFYQAAKKEDRIFKDSYSDTLYLYKKNTILKYTFTKF
ncbi:hypothetical protein [Flavobacterium macacae]|uniref:Uncharacterized protein n=1 Tax=Flavobacterium macacae TaxID=2488993 RepID=A0A3P3VZW2_9FLAO|nr:hypothetical protein [Flavobacterium macacae]RRJ87777.1 hypothetical protein EG849_15040 [Flavobacterium macacae]